jgi:hypothetical protein
MPAEQHVGCASNGDQHHSGNPYRFVMYPALKPDAGTKQPRRYEPQQDVEDLGLHLPSPSGPACNVTEIQQCLPSGARDRELQSNQDAI